ncbi:hypothetical protein [Cellvibrio sp.]|uniref:hypothetical protein n=1 Tax=Cellvibrio sp. TaxID=1965322 RepID=UPI0039647B33
MYKSVIAACSLVLLTSNASAQLGGVGLFGGGGNNGSRESMAFEKQESAREGLRREEFQKFLLDQKGEGKASPTFAGIFETARVAILKKEFAKADKSMQKLRQLEKVNAYEQAHINLLDYWYAGAQGKPEAEYEAALKVVSSGAGNIEGRTYVDIGMQVLKSQFNNQDLGGAIDTLANLRKEPASQSDLAAVPAVTKKLDDLAAQQTDIMQKITTNESGNWSAKLFKQHFYFSGVNGEISSLGFNCTNKQTTLPYKQDSIMEIPDAWGNCTMKVNAKPNTSFNIVQMQKKPN